MKDFFISYNRADKAWAEWIAWQLEEAGYTTFLQEWDFRPGSDFVLEMNKAVVTCARILAVLSPDYLKAEFTAPEWAAAFARDPQGEHGSLLPVRVRDCDISGLLSQIICIDLVGLDEEAAKSTLLGGVNRGRAKPPVQPHFPGALTHTVPKPKKYPGASSVGARAVTSRSRGGRPTTSTSRSKMAGDGHAKTDSHSDTNKEAGKASSLQPLTPKTYLLVTAVGLITVLGFLVLYVYAASYLISNGLETRVYYFSLVILGLICAAFLFGAMRSYARYSGKQLSGTLELGGAVVGAAMVVVGGLFFTEPAGTFDVTVRLNSENGERIQQGQVTLLLGRDSRTGYVTQNGEADFKEVPVRFRNRPATIMTDVKGYRIADQQTGYTLSDLITVKMKHVEGFQERQPADTFSVTVRPISSTAEPIITGKVTLTLGPDKREAPIAQNGEANIKEIPLKYRGKKVNVLVDVPEYKQVLTSIESLSEVVELEMVKTSSQSLRARQPSRHGIGQTTR